MSSTCPHNMVNFGPLVAEMFVSLGHPCKFQRVSRLSIVTARHLVVGVSQTAALNRGRHLCLAGRPSRWALAHILVMYVIYGCYYLLLLVFDLWNADLLVFLGSAHCMHTNEGGWHKAHIDYCSSVLSCYGNLC